MSNTLRPAEEIAREMVQDYPTRVTIGEDALFVFGDSFTEAPKAQRMLATLIEQSRAEVEAAALSTQQPRDLACRIRALSTRWFNAWASLGTLDLQTDAALRLCLDALRDAERHARGCPDDRSAREVVAWLRERAASSYEITRPVFAKVADALETIVRDAGEQR